MSTVVIQQLKLPQQLPIQVEEEVLQLIPIQTPTQPLTTVLAHPPNLVLFQTVSVLNLVPVLMATGQALTPVLSLPVTMAIKRVETSVFQLFVLVYLPNPVPLETVLVYNQEPAPMVLGQHLTLVLYLHVIMDIRLVGMLVWQ